jgi:hypothetical protein
MNLPDRIGPIEDATPEPLTARKAIVWGQDDLLAQAIGLFLKSTQWEVIRVPNDGAIENLIREMKRVNPEVVILCQYRVEEDAALAVRLIDEQPCLKVFTLGLDSNLMQVYSKQKIILQGASDLLSILNTGNSSDRTLENKEVDPAKQSL